MIETRPRHLSRRALLRRSLLASGGLLAAVSVVGRALARPHGPAVITSDRMRPQLPCGVQAGHPAASRAASLAQPQATVTPAPPCP